MDHKKSDFKSVDWEASLSGPHSDEIINKVSKHQLIYSITGMLLGGLCIIGGFVLFIFGISGKVSWTGKFLGATSQILDATPGSVLFIVGLFVVWVTRYAMKSTK